MSRRRLSETDKQTLADAREFIKELSSASLALLNPGHEATLFTRSRQGHVPKKERGGQLVDYSAVEVYLDLQTELARHNARIDRVYTLFYYLRSLVNG